MAEGREKNVGGEGTLQDMYGRSEKEGPGCHGHSVKIKYRLGHVVTGAFVSLRQGPRRNPCKSRPHPCTRKSWPDPCQPPRRGGGVRQTTDARGRRRWRQASPPWRAPLCAPDGGVGVGGGEWPWAWGVGAGVGGWVFRIWEVPPERAPYPHERISSQCPWQDCRYGVTWCPLGCFALRHDPTHAGMEVEGAVTHRPASPSTLESPSIGYTLQVHRGRESAVLRVDCTLCIRSTALGFSSHTKSFRSRHGRTGGDHSWWQSRCTVHPSADGCGQRWPEDEARRGRMCSFRVVERGLEPSPGGIRC